MTEFGWQRLFYNSICIRSCLGLRSTYLSINDISSNKNDRKQNKPKKRKEKVRKSVLPKIPIRRISFAGAGSKRVED